MAETGKGKKRLPSQENLLLDYVRRLEKHKAGRKVVHLRLSELRPFNRRDQHIRIAARNFEPLIADMSGQLFILKNSDLFFIYKGDAQGQTEAIVQKIRFLFDDDPLVAEVASQPHPFASWQDADADYENILCMVQSFADAEEKRQIAVRARMDARSAIRTKRKQSNPLTPEVLARVETVLERADISNLVRREFVCLVDEKMVPDPLFSDLFISIKDLRETLLPGVNLVANRWLFQHLRETLDRRMLSMLTKTGTLSVSGEISFNLNIATLQSKDFQIFDDSIAASRRGQMIIKLQQEDILSNLSSYLFVRELMQDKGYRVCLDWMPSDALHVLHRDRLGIDITKLAWSPELIDGGEEVHRMLRGLVEKEGKEKLILIQCDTREAIEFGRSIGIRKFQGRFVEFLMTEDGRRRELLRLKHGIERS